ncbi:hypothetical protein [Gordonia sp. (in: high G+C Gram-positive bacteria)]|uniref:hypothetical protein n=1 Tax=Gordonia sp. (in: high G+C Gram-positive bacteria) TaxID=84139 RepID=UPI00333FF892
MRDRWAVAAPTPAVPEIVYREVTVGDVLAHWNLAECDLHETFGVDVESGILRERSWRWLELRLRDLIDRGPRLGVALRAAA